MRYEVGRKNLQEESFKTDTKADSHQGDVAKLLKEIVTAKGNELIISKDNPLSLSLVRMTSR